MAAEGAYARHKFYIAREKKKEEDMEMKLSPPHTSMHTSVRRERRDQGRRED